MFFLHLQTSVVLSEVLHHAIWYLPILSFLVFFKTSSHSSNSFSTSSDLCCTLWGTASRYLVLTNLPQFSSRCRHIPPTLFLHLQISVVLSEVLITLSGTYQSSSVFFKMSSHSSNSFSTSSDRCCTLWGIASRYLVLTNLPQFSSRRRHIPPTLFLHLQTGVVLSEVLHHAIWYLPIFLSFLQDVVTIFFFFFFFFFVSDSSGLFQKSIK